MVSFNLVEVINFYLSFTINILVFSKKVIKMLKVVNSSRKKGKDTLSLNKSFEG